LKVTKSVHQFIQLTLLVLYKLPTFSWKMDYTIIMPIYLFYL